MLTEKYMCRAMFAVWGFLFFGLLCLPRLAVSRGWNHCLDEWLESRQAALRFVLRWLLYPAIILMDTASLPQIWNPLVSFPLASARSHLLIGGEESV